MVLRRLIRKLALNCLIKPFVSSIPSWNNKISRKSFVRNLVRSCFITNLISPTSSSSAQTNLELFCEYLVEMGMAASDDQFHVLAVDDSLIDRKLIERLLKTSSFQVTTVDSGSKALEFLGWHKDEINNSNETPVYPKNHHQEVEVNLVITDYCMPEMTGYDLLKKIKESSFLRDIPVVIMSSENVPSRITRCLEEGAEEFFLKPVRKSDVNKLQEHMMRTKIKKDVIVENEKPEIEEKQEHKEIIPTVEADSDMQQFQTAQSLHNNDSDDDKNKRKSMDEGLSPDRTRPRYSDLTVMSN